MKKILQADIGIPELTTAASRWVLSRNISALRDPLRGAKIVNYSEFLVRFFRMWPREARKTKQSRWRNSQKNN